MELRFFGPFEQLAEKQVQINRFLTLKTQSNDLTNQQPPIGKLLHDYYQCRGWSEEGIPTPEKLGELGLPD